MESDTKMQGDTGQEMEAGDMGDDYQAGLRRKVYEVVATGATPPLNLYLQFLKTKPDDIWVYVPIKWLVDWFLRYKSRATIYRTVKHGAIASRDYPNGKVYHLFHFMNAIGREID